MRVESVVLFHNRAMDDFAMLFLLLGLLILYLFVGATVGLMARSGTRALQGEVNRLSNEVTKLRREMTEGPVETPDRAVAEIRTSDIVSEELPEQSDDELEDSEPISPLDVAESDATTEEPAEDIEDGGETEEQEPQPVAAKANFEETLGTKWAVWVGGLALALGAVFLVKFSIDRGLLSPGVRIASGLGFSALLAMVGEWTRRRGASYNFAGFEQASIPAVLTAAGTMGAFATIYAAYQLYGMIGDLTAFLALGIVAVATTVLALLHGPLLAALGIIASYVAPFLVSSDDPSVMGLGLYVIAVSVAGFAVARLRFWKWMAITASLGLAGYGVILHAMSGLDDRMVLALYVIISFSLTAYIFIVSLYQRFNTSLEKHDWAALVLPTLFMLLAGLQLSFDSDFLSGIMLVLAVVAGLALAAAYGAVRGLAFSAMGVGVLGYLGWHLDLFAIYEGNWGQYGEAVIDQRSLREDLTTFAIVGTAIGGSALAIGYQAARLWVTRCWLSIAGAFLPMLMLAIAWIKLDLLSASLSFAFVAFVLFALFLFISNRIYSQLDKDAEGRDGASAAWSIASFVALAASVSMALEQGALTVALAMLVPAISYTNYRRALPALRPLAVLASGLWMARIVWNPRIVDGDVGSWPIFNWITWGYGVPALGFIASVWLLSKHGRDRWLEAMEAIAIATTIAAVSLIALHAIAPDQVFTPIDTLFEAGYLAIISAGAALGLLRISVGRGSHVISQAATWIGYVGMAFSAANLIVLFNPWFTRDNFGSGVIFNGLLFAYVMPAVLYVLLGWYARHKRPPAYYRAALILGGVLSAIWVNLTIRHIFHPEHLHRGSTTDMELYTYSAIWLLAGVGMLAAGIYFNRKLLRQIAIGIVVVVVAKVFLIDMAGLTGLFRALSFIGLGVVLVAIGLVYQRVLSKGMVAPVQNGDESADE